MKRGEPLTFKPFESLNGLGSHSGIILGKKGQPQAAETQNRVKTGDNNHAEKPTAKNNLKEKNNMNEENLEVQPAPASVQPRGKAVPSQTQQPILLQPVIDLGPHMALAAEKVDELKREVKELTSSTKDLKMAFERRESTAEIVGAGIGAVTFGAGGGLIVAYATPSPTTQTVLGGTFIGLIGGAMVGRTCGRVYDTFTDPARKGAKKSKKDEDKS